MELYLGGDDETINIPLLTELLPTAQARLGATCLVEDVPDREI